MATSTTTFAAIRDALITVVEGLTPSVATASTHADVTFRCATKFVTAWDFQEWCEDNPNACLRYFHVEQEGWEPEGAYDAAIQRRRSEMQITIAYPKQSALYGAEPVLDMMDMMEGDGSQILYAVGRAGSSNYPAGSNPVDESQPKPEPGDSVVFLTIPVVMDYYYDTTQ